MNTVLVFHAGKQYKIMEIKIHDLSALQIGETILITITTNEETTVTKFIIKESHIEEAPFKVFVEEQKDVVECFLENYQKTSFNEDEILQPGDTCPVCGNTGSVPPDAKPCELCLASSRKY